MEIITSNNNININNSSFGSSFDSLISDYSNISDSNISFTNNNDNNTKSTNNYYLMLKHSSNNIEPRKKKSFKQEDNILYKDTIKKEYLKVSNLTYNVTKEHLTEIFSCFGNIINIHLISNFNNSKEFNYFDNINNNNLSNSFNDIDIDNYRMNNYFSSKKGNNKHTNFNLNILNEALIEFYDISSKVINNANECMNKGVIDGNIINTEIICLSFKELSSIMINNHKIRNSNKVYFSSLNKLDIDIGSNNNNNNNLNEDNLLYNNNKSNDDFLTNSINYKYSSPKSKLNILLKNSNSSIVKKKYIKRSDKKYKKELDIDYKEFNNNNKNISRDYSKLKIINKENIRFRYSRSRQKDSKK